MAPVYPHYVTRFSAGCTNSSFGYPIGCEKSNGKYNCSIAKTKVVAKSRWVFRCKPRNCLRGSLGPEFFTVSNAISSGVGITFFWVIVPNYNKDGFTVSAQ